MGACAARAAGVCERVLRAAPRDPSGPTRTMLGSEAQRKPSASARAASSSVGGRLRRCRDGRGRGRLEPRVANSVAAAVSTARPRGRRRLGHPSRTKVVQLGGPALAGRPPC
eukprot:scaffold119032_cov69-Phaeocystis_antarctica.AAC.4